MAFIINTNGVFGKFDEEVVKNNPHVGNFVKHYFPHDPIFKPSPECVKKHKTVYVPKKEDVEKVLKVASGQDYLMLKFFVLSGAKEKEGLMVKWSDINFEKDIIYLGNKTPDLGEAFDFVPLDEELKVILLEFKEKQPIKSEFVFVNDDPESKGYGKPYKTHSLFMKEICEKAGVPYFGFSSIRRFTAMQLLDVGYPKSYIQRVLRHKYESSTSQYILKSSLITRQFKEQMENL